MKVLYLVHRLPYPPDKGDRIRAYHLLKYLAKHVRVHLASLADEPVEASTVKALEQICERVAIVPLGSTRWLRGLASVARGRSVTEGVFSSPTFRQVLKEWTQDTHFDVALASASSMVPYLRSKELRSVPAVIDLVDVDSQKWFDYAEGRRGLKTVLYRLEGKRLRQLERDLPTWARAVTLVSEGEAAIYRRFCSRGPVHVVTNGVDFDYFQFRQQATEPACVFVGAMDYLPNVDGAVWFCKHVWPELHQSRPELRFYLVGRKPTREVAQLGRVPGVEVVGQVPDVRPYLDKSSVAIIPLRIARGVQNKVLEALAMGKAVVASPESLAGLRATPGLHLLAASTPQEWKDSIRRLLDDEDLRRQLGTAGRQYVEENHCWDRCLEPLLSLLGLPLAEGVLPHPALARAGGQE